MNMIPKAAVACVAIALLGMTPIVRAQPDDPSRPLDVPPNRELQRSQRQTPESLRARLERRLEAVKNQQERIEQALAILDEGGSVEKAMSELRPRARGRVLRHDAGPGDPEVSPEAGPPEPPQRRGVRRVGRPGPPELTEQDRTRIRALVAEHMPELSAKLDRLETEDPKAAAMLTQRLGGMLLATIETTEGDPQSGRLKLEELKANFRVVEIAHKMRAAQGDEPALEQLKGELRTTLAHQFDARAKLARLEIDRLRARVDELLQDAQRREQGRTDEIDKRIESITRRSMRGRRHKNRKNTDD